MPEYAFIAEPLCVSLLFIFDKILVISASKFASSNFETLAVINDFASSLPMP